MGGTGEWLRSGWRYGATAWAIAANLAKYALFHVLVFGLLPAMPVKLAFFGYIANKVNVYHCPSLLCCSGGVAHRCLSSLINEGCGIKQQNTCFCNFP